MSPYEGKGAPEMKLMNGVLSAKFRLADFGLVRAFTIGEMICDSRAVQDGHE